MHNPISRRAFAGLVLAAGFSLPAIPAVQAADYSKENPLKVVLVLHGTLGDKSFFDSAAAGLEKAKAIIEYREKNGLFRSADDLLKVVGIGPATVERNRARIVVDKNQVAKLTPSGD